jgi:tetratricopeptide (TPR) repeat protein
MSRQPADGRFHRIRVSSSVPGAQVYARKGYYAGRGGGPAPGPDASLENEDWEAVLAKTNDALRDKDLPEASRNLEKLVRRFPSEVNLWYNLGAVRMQLKENAAAVDAFQRAFLLSHENAGIGIALTRSLVAAGFPDAAVDTMEAVVHRNPGNLELMIQLGRTYEAASRATEAYQTYRMILDLTLAPPLDLYILLLRTAVTLGRETEAGVFASDYAARGGDMSLIEQWYKPTTSASPQSP